MYHGYKIPSSDPYGFEADAKESEQEDRLYHPNPAKQVGSFVPDYGQLAGIAGGGLQNKRNAGDVAGGDGQGAQKVGQVADVMGASGGGGAMAGAPMGLIVGALAQYQGNLDRMAHSKKKLKFKDLAQIAFPTQAGMFGDSAARSGMAQGMSMSPAMGGMFGGR